jgi:hypothetical protein
MLENTLKTKLFENFIFAEISYASSVHKAATRMDDICEASMRYEQKRSKPLHFSTDKNKRSILAAEEFVLPDACRC